MGIFFHCCKDLVQLKNIFGRNNNNSNDSENGNKHSRNTKCVEKARYPKYQPTDKGNITNDLTLERKESFHSTLRPSKKSKDFIVLTPASYTHLRENYREKPEPSAKAALHQAIFRFKSGQHESARYYYEVAAMHGSAYAMHNLGTMYLHGQGIPKDPKIARDYFTQSATEGIPLSMSQLGYIYLYGKGVQPNYQKAREWFLRADEVGQEPYAQYCLGAIYICGYGVEKDASRGMSWLFKSANNNFMPAIFNIAVFYEKGECGLSPSPLLAMSFYMQAAQDGGGDEDYAQNNLGALYCRAEKNYQEAVCLFRMAESKGLSEAMFNLGEAHVHGIGVPKDLMKGMQYYYRAATAGKNSDAEYALADVFLYGIDGHLEPNIKVAMYWLERAADNGHKGAQKDLLILKTR